MKKIGALSFATFYLMLTTGLFVCMLHCSGQSLFVPEKAHAAAAKDTSAAHERTAQQKTASHQKTATHPKSCAKDKDCNCCDEHGEYVIKENIKRGTLEELTVPSIVLAVKPSFFPDLLISENLISAGKWCLDFSPPPNVKTPLYISNRVLLI
ncbi:hypothetical protein [Pedobacter caeni]|uniref:Uncharacterized protein n=1 Tax=Pedobacter caeni TaxID=288992 RepID=A0A1M5LF20_9SPHI|nr:hypothetical protein [Pedobacter caeni]SHG63661.1 hypothetical protein SAMN04488522_106322 [Pedobacter caeni]